MNIFACILKMFIVLSRKFGSMSHRSDLFFKKIFFSEFCILVTMVKYLICHSLMDSLIDVH